MRPPTGDSQQADSATNEDASTTTTTTPTPADAAASNAVATTTAVVVPSSAGVAVPRSKQRLLDFQKVRRLGIGKYAKVFVCRRSCDIEGGKDYAMKEVRMNTGCHNEYLLRERDLLILCAESQFIVGLLCTFRNPSRQKAYLILELGEGGDLYELHEDVHLFNETEARFYLAEIVCGLEFMHQRGIIHRDVKGENILLTGSGHVMLCDLGLARQLQGPEDRARTFCGTLSYMSPEMMRRQRYGTKTDIWSLGVLLAFLVTGEEPILGNNEDEKQSNIVKGRYHLSCIAKMSYACRSLITNMLKANPDQRPTATELKSRRFLNKLDWFVVANGGLPPPHRPRYDRKARPVDAAAAAAADVPARKSRGDSEFRFGAPPVEAAAATSAVTSGSAGGEAKANSGEARQQLMDDFDWVSPELLADALAKGLSISRDDAVTATASAGVETENSSDKEVSDGSADLVR